MTYIKGDLVLLRGLPGSGKTTLGEIISKNFSSNNNVISADDFFTDHNGTYVYDAEKIGQAHRQCELNCATLMQNGSRLIVVANTFTQKWEMNPYYEMATHYGYRVHSVVVENRHEGVNVHNVPMDKIEFMRERFEIEI